MRILLDECLPRQLKRSLKGHNVKTVTEAGWAGLQNGMLLAKIAGKFDFFVTIDRNMVAQNPGFSREFGIVVLTAPTNRLEDIEPLLRKPQLLFTSENIGRVVRLKL